MSTPSVPLDIMQELNALFEWNPPPLRLAPEGEGGSRSKSSRAAAFYDMHLARHLILTTIKHVKHLHKKIARVVDNKLKSIEERGITLPSPMQNFETDEQHRRAVKKQEKLMKNEKSVEAFYFATTVPYCVYVASTLALHPGIWDTAVGVAPGTASALRELQLYEDVGVNLEVCCAGDGSRSRISVSQAQYPQTCSPVPEPSL